MRLHNSFRLRQVIKIKPLSWRGCIPINNQDDDVEFFTTSQGEVYGFADKEGNIYLDETKISPEHPGRFQKKNENRQFSEKRDHLISENKSRQETVWSSAAWWKKNMVVYL